MTSNALFLSSNMAKVEVKISNEGNQCLLEGMVISIINKNDPNDCSTRIFAKDNCNELINVRNNPFYILLF